jgi:hypothetical protein
VLNQQAVFDDQNIGSNPVHGLETRKSSMDDYKVLVSHNNAMLIFQRRGKSFHQVEETFPAWLNMCAVLPRRPPPGDGLLWS